MRVAVVVCSLALIACAPGRTGLDLTLDFDSSVSDAQLAEVVKLTFTVAGDESGTYSVSPSRAFARSERVVYLAGERSRAISLVVAAYDRSGTLLARGGSAAIALDSGVQRPAEITLYGDGVPDGGQRDEGYFDSATDALAGPHDLAGIDPALVGWWKFDEGSGTSAADSSGNGNTGTLSGGPTWVTGVSGGALQFSSGSTVVVKNAPNLSGMDTLTVAAWVKLPATPTTQTLLSKRGQAPVDESYALFAGGGDAGSFQIEDASGNEGFSDGATNLTADTWHHLAGVYDGARVLLYLDGASDGDAFPQSGSIGVSLDPLYLGYGNFSGVLDDVRVYARALLPAEINALYQNP